MTQTNITPAVQRFNQMVAEFDTLTGGKYDTASARDIFETWLWIDSNRAWKFWEVCGDAGEYLYMPTPQNDAK
jgi:hypothetical protein